MRKLSLLLALSALSITGGAQQMVSLDSGWKFFRGAAISAESLSFCDSSWRDVTVPHDYSVEPVEYVRDYRYNTPEWENWQVGPFSRLSIGDWDSGQMVGGEGWYRKTIELPVEGSIDDYLSSHNLEIRFDGVYNQSEVWINGQKAAVNLYGYMPFNISLNPILSQKSGRNPAGDNLVTIAVKSVNQGLNCRWYSGSGIFRHVWLHTSGNIHLHEWDTFVDASNIQGKGSRQQASIKISAKVHGWTEKSAPSKIMAEIIDSNGQAVASASKDIDSIFMALTIPLQCPRLWSVDSPYRYTARISVHSVGSQSDKIDVKFGIRSIDFSAEKGFLLNGKPTKLRGGCVHHDNGILGAAAIDRAEQRKVELMKAQGYNAIRCSHNLPSVAFLDACDSLGMLVIDECFDQWEQSKRKDDYSNIFSKEKLMIVDGRLQGMGITNFEYDAALMARRDRNHPSIIMWSIGNEIAQRSDVPRGHQLAQAICQCIKSMDPTRPTTLAVNDYWDRTAEKMTWEKDSPRAFENVEIGGYNFKKTSLRSKFFLKSTAKSFSKC